MNTAPAIVLAAALLFLPLPVHAKTGPSLKSLFEKKGKQLGVAVDLDALKADPAYGKLVAAEFSVITPETVMKFRETEPDRGRYTFADTDAIMAFAASNGLGVRGHTLVWHRALPKWLRKKYTRSVLLDILRRHIQTVARHTKGKVYAWDVVNEAFEDDGSYRKTMWYKAVGPAYIEMSFGWAHRADPDALLFYNDYNIEGLTPKSDAVYALLKRLKEKGVPVHGIGFQAHLNVHDKDALKGLRENIERFEALGLKIHFTELDVSMQQRSRHSPMPVAEKKETQLKMYREIFETCWDSQNCDAIVVWGLTDAHTWLRNFPVRMSADTPTLFDAAYRRKPIYQEIVKTLENRSSSLFDRI